MRATVCANVQYGAVVADRSSGQQLGSNVESVVGGRSAARVHDGPASGHRSRCGASGADPGQWGIPQRAATANAPSDARGVADVLRRLGFSVFDGIDLDRADTDALIHRFARELDGAEVALFFYSGHGLQVGGENYLVPVDAQLQHEADLDFETIPLRRIMTQLERNDRTSIVILDACRDNPFLRRVASRSAATRGGLAPLQGGVGTLIAYATAPDTVALDGTNGHSPFTASLLAHIETPGLEIGQLLKKVRSDVIGATDKAQVPWDHSSLVGDFYFVPPHGCAGVPGRRRPPARSPPTSSDSGTRRNRSKAPIARSRRIEAYLSTYPAGAFATLAKLQLDDLRAKQAGAEGGRQHRPLRGRGHQPDEPAHGRARARAVEPGGRRPRATWGSTAPNGGRSSAGSPSSAWSRVGPTAISARRPAAPSTRSSAATGCPRPATSTAPRWRACAMLRPRRRPSRPRHRHACRPRSRRRRPRPRPPRRARWPPPPRSCAARPSDPSWMEPRLIMLFQCDRLGGKWTLP